MGIHVQSTALLCAMETRYFARDQEANQVAKNPTHVITLTLRPKEMILVVYAQAIVLKIVRPTKSYVLVKKIVMVVIQKRSADQKLKTGTESFALMIQLLMPAQFNAMKQLEP